MANLIGDFVTEFPGRIAEIHRLNGESRWEELDRAAHSLKGLTALLGFQKLSDNFLAVEDAADAKDGEVVKNALSTLDAQAGLASQQLKEWLEAYRQRAVG